MDENLKQLVRQLRKETCPQKVIDEVDRRRSASTRHPRPFRYALIGVVASLVILSVVTSWQPPAGRDAPQPHEQATHTNPEGKRIAREAEGALGYIGAILLDAGTHSGNVILKGAVPPMQNSLQTAKKKIEDHI